MNTELKNTVILDIKRYDELIEMERIANQKEGDAILLSESINRTKVKLITVDEALREIGEKYNKLKYDTPPNHTAENYKKRISDLEEVNNNLMDQKNELRAHYQEMYDDFRNAKVSDFRKWKKGKKLVGRLSK